MIIHAKDGQFQENEIAELKEMLDARGGQGLILIEEGKFSLVSPGWWVDLDREIDEGDMEDDYEPHWIWCEERFVQGWE